MEAKTTLEELPPLEVYQFPLKKLVCRKIIFFLALTSPFILMQLQIIPRAQFAYVIGLDKGGYPVNIFLISPRKHMLWVLIRSALVRHF